VVITGKFTGKVSQIFTGKGTTLGITYNKEMSYH
jgi:hypothetical protein